jgi:hypothetical protein
LSAFPFPFLSFLPFALAASAAQAPAVAFWADAHTAVLLSAAAATAVLLLTTAVQFLEFFLESQSK